MTITIIRVFFSTICAWTAALTSLHRRSARLFLREWINGMDFKQHDQEIANLVVFPDFTDKIVECFINVDSLFRRRFDKFASKVFGKVAALFQIWCNIKYHNYPELQSGEDAPFMPTCRSYSRSHLFATTITGKESWSFTRRICWWNVLISSNELREVIE
jgi:hypothetical protein